MNTRVRIFTATEMGWQRSIYGNGNKNVWERPDGTLIAVPGAAEPQCTIVDYPFESYKNPWRGLSQWVLNWKLDEPDKELV